MKRHILTPRENWQKWCEEIEFHFHTLGANEYWRESAAYEFSAQEVEQIESATDALHAMCMEIVSDCVKRGEYHAFGFPKAREREIAQLVDTSWQLDRHCSMYGRFDFGARRLEDGSLDLKMFEYNADTPTALYEASVVQWKVLEDRSWNDQFNSIHEKLIEFFISQPISAMHFAAMRDAGPEDWGTIAYLVDVASECGRDASMIAVEDIGWDAKAKVFKDLKDVPIKHIFKLYPWEWMLFGNDEFGAHIRDASTQWVEPAWKLLLTSKAILPLLWERYPKHPLLLESHRASDERSRGRLMRGTWVKKPMYSREGANITLVKDGVESALTGSAHNPFYDEFGYIGQAYFDCTKFGDAMYTPVIGSWVINGEAAGMGIREDIGVTGNGSCFVPHYFK